MDKKDFAPLIDQHLVGIYNFAFRVTNSTERAEEVTREVFLRAYIGRAKLPALKKIRSWLIKIAIHVAQQGPDNHRMTFDYLDDTIRGDPTQVTRTDVLTDPERSVMLWELKQGCMTAVLNCLSPGERMAFILVVMLDMRSADAAATLGITPAALKVRLSRAKKKIVDYLAPRCEHVHPMNPCHCPSRLGVALRKGFIKNVPGSEVSLRRKPPENFNQAVPLRDVVAIYRQLPEPGVSIEFQESLEQELDDGSWDRIAAAGQKPKK